MAKRHPHTQKRRGVLGVCFLLCSSLFVWVYSLQMTAMLPLANSIDPFVRQDAGHAAAPVAEPEKPRASELLTWGYEPAAYVLSIPRLEVQAPVLRTPSQFWDTQDWALLEHQMQAGLRHGTVAYPHSVEPGEIGNIIIAGHSSAPDPLTAKSEFADVFADLSQVRIGDRVLLKTGGRTVTYLVQDMRVVTPEQTDVLLPQRKTADLKIITCHPLGTSKNRLVVTARAEGDSD